MEQPILREIAFSGPPRAVCPRRSPHGLGQKALKEIHDHLREDITKVDEPQLKAMFETSAEVLGGLIKAFSDYEKKNEPSWRSILRIKPVSARLFLRGLRRDGGWTWTWCRARTQETVIIFPAAKSPARILDRSGGRASNRSP